MIRIFSKINSLIFLVWIIIPNNLFSQPINQTGFESFTDEQVFNQAAWISEGFTVPWVDGFNNNRAFVDNAYSYSGSNSLRILFPQGQFGPVATGAQAPLMVTPSSQLYISYWLRFSDNFSWGTTSEGGKLPGLAGGGRCSGCATCTGTNGFSARLMWRTGGTAVLYLYHMDKVGACGDNLYLQTTPGINFTFQKGQWYNIIEKVRVNTGNNFDGEVQIWVNQQLALTRTGIRFVNNGNRVDNLYFSTFHGGNSAAWAPTVDCYIWFDDVKITANPADIFTVLPVEYASFTAEKQGLNALVSWSTSSEKNSAYFMIEKSTDGITFESIGRVEAAGNSNSLLNYSSFDNKLASGTSYYRLAQYDIDGKVNYSEVKSVSREGIKEVKIVPNPNNGSFTVFVEGLAENAHIKLILRNALSQVVFESSESAASVSNVNIQHLPSSIYFLEVQTEEGSLVTKVVKE